MDLREMLLAQVPAFFLLSILFLIAHLRVRKRSAVKSVLWVLLFGAALAVSILFCFLGMQAKYWTVKTLFELKFWSWLGRPVLRLHAEEAEQDRHGQRRAEQQHPQHRLDGAVLAHAQVRDQKQQTQQKKRRELRK